MLADLESIERRMSALEKKAKTGDKETKLQLALMTKAAALLKDGKPAREAVLSAEEREPYRQLGLLTQKPVLYVCNVDEGSAASGNAYSARAVAMAKAQGAGAAVVSVRIEEELAQLPEAERAEFLASLGLTEPGLNRIIRAGYDLLGLITFFTAGPKEARAWTVAKGARAPQAAGVIHSDFEKGFIRAETITYEDYIAGNGEAGAREAGKFRLEGKDYVVQDGDVMHFRFNV
jgi:GTP-binding protein YchF